MNIWCLPKGTIPFPAPAFSCGVGISVYIHLYTSACSHAGQFQADPAASALRYPGLPLEEDLNNRTNAMLLVKHWE